MLEESRIEIKIGSYGVASGAALKDPALLSKVQSYRRQKGAGMIALDREAAKLKLPASDYHISRKVDGEFSVIVWDGQRAILLNPGGTARVGLPVLEEAATLLLAAGVGSALIAAELYVERGDGKRARVHDVSRVARKPESLAALETLRLAVFDVLEWNGSSIEGGFENTWNTITTVFGKGQRIAPVEAVQGKDAKAVLSQFEKWVDGEGAEGLVVRSDSAGIFKVKPRHTLDVVVIGFAEGVDDRVGMLHDLLLAILRSDGSFQLLGRVGGGFSDEQRKIFLADLQDMEVESEYAEVNSDRVAYRMVEPRWIAEISCLDLVAETTRGGTIDRMVLNWNHEFMRWETIRRLPLVSVISPQFVRLRDDKKVDPLDIRIQQLTDIVPVPMADKTARDLALSGSEILRREVVTKTLKGKEMVRKLLMWKTNKETESPDYPAYVVHLTDFSPNRKEPLQREIRVSNSRDQIKSLWDELAVKYFVRGWNSPEE
ncbi:MAG: ATP-dependent DNA ligase [Verrucomicrobiae bacterium]|nr:ATP-dependent DNA ligase [Verrucomicrobiae bacterium]